MIHRNLLSGKNILLIAPDYFGYEKDIIAELKSFGANVFYIQENIDYTKFQFKLLNRSPQRLRNKICNNHFLNEFKKLESIDLDIIFCIRIDLFNEYILDYLKSKFKNSTYILYFWDSCKNMRNAEVISTYFDKIYTFDKKDAEDHAAVGWKFRPLFFTKEYNFITQENTNNTTDLLYIASLSQERAQYYIQLEKYCKKNGLSLDVYFFCKNSVFYWNRIFMKEFQKVPRYYIHNKGLTKEELIKKLKRTKAVFDCSHSSQTGLTMRTIECLGSSKKMITTNKQILEYDFYKNCNILLIDGYDFSEIEKFIRGDGFQQLDEKIINK